VEVEGGGLGVTGVGGRGTGALGRLMTCSICRMMGFTPGFAASKAATDKPSLAAIEVKVSPDWILYVLAAGGGGGG
jgi:hypothetical protein